MTPGTQKGSPFSSKGGSTKYKKTKTETKDLGMKTHPGEDVVMAEKFLHSRKLPHGGSVGIFEISEGNITRRTHTHT